MGNLDMSEVLTALALFYFISTFSQNKIVGTWNTGEENSIGFFKKEVQWPKGYHDFPADSLLLIRIKEYGRCILGETLKSTT